MFLGEKDTLLVIIVKELTPLKEEKLICMLKENKTTIGWTIADIKGISLPCVCTGYYWRRELNQLEKPNAVLILL